MNEQFIIIKELTQLEKLSELLYKEEIPFYIKVQNESGKPIYYLLFEIDEWKVNILKVMLNKHNTVESDVDIAEHWNAIMFRMIKIYNFSKLIYDSWLQYLEVSYQDENKLYISANLSHYKDSESALEFVRKKFQVPLHDTIMEMYNIDFEIVMEL